MRDEMDDSITPVIMTGGAGTRLWPLSRQSYPKQFVPLFGGNTMFQQSLERMIGTGFTQPIILTNSSFRFIVTEQMSKIGVDPKAILIEPQARNTAPAVLAAALWLERTSPNSLMLVAPADHLVPDAEAFRAAVASGREAALAGRLVTFGIRPDRPETGYGYLELAESASECSIIRGVKRFVEKPDLDTAERMVADTRFLWNSGIFLFSVQAILKSFDEYAPHLVDPVRRSVDTATMDLGFLRLAEVAFAEAEDVSIDYAIMERASNLSVVPFERGWSDLGGWEAVWHESNKDDSGVAVSGSVISINCQDSLLRSEADRMQLVGVGLRNIVAIAMPDAVLVADIRNAQDVKEAVAELRRRGIEQATQLPVDHRPWGWFESLVVGNRFQVKRIVVHPGRSLSLQSHMHRSEHWIVVAGTAKVTIDADVRLLGENQSIFIPLGAIHRMENPGKVDMVLIEVQTGSYLREDDIIRYEDLYARH